MQDVLSFYISKFPDYLQALATMIIVPGVSLLGIIFGFFIVCYILHTLLLRN